MRIAIPYNTDETIYEHYGTVDQFKIFDVDKKQIVSSEFMLIYKHDVKETALRLAKKNVDIIICGNIGDTAKENVYKQGMILFGGVSGNPDKAVMDFLEGNLQYDPKVATELNGEDGDEVGSCSCGCGHEHNHEECCSSNNNSCGCSDGCGCTDNGSCCSDGGCGCKH